VTSHTLACSVLFALGGTITIGCGGRATGAGSGNDGGGPSSGGADSGAPEAACPATYADVPQGSFETNTSCSTDESCSYFDQFTCFCEQGSGWECVQANCLCEPGEGGCVNATCSTDADCPSGQHCAVNLGSPPRVCSVGCEGDASACPSGTTCKMFAP
jgi:hypothetical protein